MHLQTFMHLVLLLLAVVRCQSIRHPLDLSHCISNMRSSHAGHFWDDLRTTSDLDIVSALVLGERERGLDYLATLLSGKPNVVSLSLLDDVERGAWTEPALQRLHAQAVGAPSALRRVVLVLPGPGPLTAANVTALNVIMKTLEAGARFDTPQGRLSLAGAAVLLFIDSSVHGVPAPASGEPEDVRAAVQEWLAGLAEAQARQAEAQGQGASVGTRAMNIHALLGRFRHFLALPIDDGGSWQEAAASDPACRPDGPMFRARLSPGATLGTAMAAIALALACISRCTQRQEGSTSGHGTRVTHGRGPNLVGETKGLQYHEEAQAERHAKDAGTSSVRHRGHRATASDGSGTAHGHASSRGPRSATPHGPSARGHASHGGHAHVESTASPGAEGSGQRRPASASARGRQGSSRAASSKRGE